MNTFLRSSYTILEYIQKGTCRMQNYRNNAMPYNNGYGNYRSPAQMPVTHVERRATEQCTTDRCVAANTDRCTCESGSVYNDDMVLAMAYVKWQKWQKIYDVEKALHCGTIFQELNLPFCGIGGCQK